MKINYSEIINSLENLIPKLWRENEFSHESISKGKFDVVTETDLKFEEIILNELSRVAPQVNVLSEETHNDTEEKGTFFTVDPIDGTWNFTNNIPIYGTQVSIVEDGKPTLGYIYLPTLNYNLSAIDGKGAQFNKKSVNVVNKKITRTTVGTADLRKFNDSNFLIALEKELNKTFGRVRMCGASCFDYSMVTIGSYQGKISDTPHLWDIAPGIVLVREAGGYAEYCKQYSIAASSKEIFDKILECYNKVKK